MKLGALLMVTVAWLILAIQQEMIIELTAPIRYTNIPAELIMDDGSPKSVGLTLAGRRHRIGELEKVDITVRVDLSALSYGDHLIQLSSADINLPMGVTLERISPQKLQVKLKLRLPQQGGKLGL
jgi:YbbR domain-containing protein